MRILINETVYNSLFLQEREQDVDRFNLAYEFREYILDLSRKASKEVFNRLRDKSPSTQEVNRLLWWVFGKPSMEFKMHDNTYELTIYFNGISKFQFDKIPNDFSVTYIMSEDGVMHNGSYLRSDDIITIYTSSPHSIGDPIYFFREIEDEIILSSRTLTHEVTHMLDQYKTDGKIFKKYIGSPNFPNRADYANEEDFNRAVVKYRKEYRAYRLQNAELSAIFIELLTDHYQYTMEYYNGFMKDWNTVEGRKSAVLDHFDVDDYKGHEDAQRFFSEILDREFDVCNHKSQMDYIIGEFKSKVHRKINPSLMKKIKARIYTFTEAINEKIFKINCKR